MSRIAYPFGDRLIEDLVAPCTSPVSPLPSEIHIDLKTLNSKIDNKEERKTSISWSRELTNPRELFKIPIPGRFYVKLPSIEKEKQFFKPNETWRELAEIGARKEVNLLNIPDKLPSSIESSLHLSSPIVTVKKENKQTRLRQIDMTISITPREVLQRRHHVRQVQEKLQNILLQTKHSNKRRSKKYGLKDEFLRQKSILGLTLCCPSNIKNNLQRSNTGLIPVHSKLTSNEDKTIVRSNTCRLDDLAIISRRLPQVQKETKNDLSTKTNTEKPTKTIEISSTKIFNLYQQNKTSQSFARLNDNPKCE